MVPAMSEAVAHGVTPAAFFYEPPYVKALD
jgi:hypothetical protein